MGEYRRTDPGTAGEESEWLADDTPESREQATLPAPPELDSYVTDLASTLPDVPELQTLQDQLDRGEQPSPDDIERVVDTISQQPVAPESTSLLQRLRGLPRNVRRTTLALVTAVELLGSGVAFAKPRDSEESSTPTRTETRHATSEADDPAFKVIKGKRDIGQPLHFVVGHHTVGVQDFGQGAFLRHNLHRPESLKDGLTMFVEPVSLHFNFTYKQDTWEGRLISGDTPEDDFVLSLDVPYEHARDFKKATPQEQERMEKDFLSRAKAFVDFILPVVFGPSFFKDDVQRDTAPTSHTNITKTEVDGSSSGEATFRVDSDDPRNQTLSELRGENGALIVKKIYEENGVSFNAIKHRGVGELHMTPEERAKLREDALELNLANPRTPEEQAILALIEQYNDHHVTEPDVRQRLEEIVGAKRKVAITLEADERTGVLVLPIPLAIMALLRLWPRRHPRGQHTIHMLPRWSDTPGASPAELTAARRYGRQLPPAYPDGRRGDIVKGYAAPTEPTEQVAGAAVETARHRRKGQVRFRAELAFQPVLSLDEQVEGLAAVLLRQTQSLAALERRGHRDRGDIDLVNAMDNPHALDALLQRIIEPRSVRGSDGRERLEPLPRITPETPPIEFRTHRVPPLPGRPEGERSSMRVVVGGRTYAVSYSRLQELADAHRAWRAPRT
ncbi:MAG: hypothetical protein HY341_01055 [Candidatus Kerfeldbacteria bacterium]|nr:hypothetical protein [Candidatus Kerfeldbacteria bacterium]